MSTPLRTYYRGHNLVTMRDETTFQNRVYHFDHQGSTQCMTNDVGSVTDRFVTDAWGVNVKTTGTSLNVQRYIGGMGYYAQRDLELDYVRARYYSPRAGRFSSAEPYGISTLMTLYTYGDNAPSRLTDP